MKRCLLVVTLLLAGASFALHAQMQIRPGGKPIILGKDTICYRYRFAPSDTLYVRIESRDSIVVPGYDPIEKERTEGLRIICDSARNETYWLSMKILSYTERQRSGSDSSSRTSHPWKQRTMRLHIDSLGRRLHASVDDSSRALTSPGGMFQALRLPIIDSSCRRQNQSWMSSDTLFVPENGVPAPEIRQRVLWRTGDLLDTLGRPAAWLQYTLTGFAGVDVPDTSVKVTTIGTVAEFGRLVLDRGLGLPLSSSIWQEVRFRIQSGEQRNTAGRHLVVSTLSLMEVRAADPARRWRNPDQSVFKRPTPTVRPKSRNRR
jgi:hypothetical protein